MGEVAPVTEQVVQDDEPPPVTKELSFEEKVAAARAAYERQSRYLTEELSQRESQRSTARLAEQARQIGVKLVEPVEEDEKERVPPTEGDDVEEEDSQLGAPRGEQRAIRSSIASAPAPSSGRSQGSQDAANE